jgi:UDP-glucose 4-epimerase
MSKTVIITGASGFLAGYAASALTGAGRRVIGLDKDGSNYKKHPAQPVFESFTVNPLSEVNDIVPILDRFAPAYCIHFAGPANVGASFSDPLKDFENQTLPLIRLLEAMRITGAECRVLLVSSAAVYGDPASLPVREDHRIMPISPYGYHKYHQELLLDEYTSLHGVKTCKARIFSTYGPGMKQLAVWDIARRALAGDYTIIGTGEETRDYLYVGDVAEALRLVCEVADFNGEVYNVASGTELEIRDLAAKIYAALGHARDPIIAGPQGPGIPKRWRADITRLIQLGFLQKVKIDDGICLTVRWIVDHA